MENLDHLVDLITDRLMEKLKKKPWFKKLLRQQQFRFHNQNPC